MIKTAVLLTALCLRASFAKDVTLHLKTKINQDNQPPYLQSAFVLNAGSLANLLEVINLAEWTYTGREDSNGRNYTLISINGITATEGQSWEVWFLGSPGVITSVPINMYVPPNEATILFKLVSTPSVGGWTPVTRGEWIDWDLENAPLEIKTRSRMGSNDHMYLQYYTPQDESYIGGFFVRFWPTPQYHLLEYCDYTWNDFPVTLPSATEKIWRITLDKSEGVRVKIHCNGELVVNVQLLDRRCYYWKKELSETLDVTKIFFNSRDTASEYYRRN